LGLVLAIAGLVYLVSPGLSAPSPLGAGLMAIAGVAWGVYSLRGRRVADPLGATAGNFARAVPLALLVSLVFVTGVRLTGAGVALAIASGAAASGLGYVIWYAALGGLSATRAATVQLSVPMIAAFGGVPLLSEAITPRLLVATVAILGGIALVLAQRKRKQGSRSCIEPPGPQESGCKSTWWSWPASFTPRDRFHAPADRFPSPPWPQ
jgi:drug/metabolite transporter (DMT)-like permease